MLRVFYERREEAASEAVRMSLRRVLDLTGISADTIRGCVDWE